MHLAVTAPSRATLAGAHPLLALGGGLGGLGGACIAAVALRLPTFRYPLVSDDEAIYDAMAQVVVRGGVMYRDTVDHKPPGLVSTYSALHGAVTHLGGSFGAVMASVHVTGILFVVLTCVALHAIATETLAPGLARFPPLLYAFASAASVPPDALAVNGELLMNLPAAVAVALAVRSVRARGLTRIALVVGAGASCGAAALYKYQGGFVALALPFVVLSLAPGKAAPARGERVAWLMRRLPSLVAFTALLALGVALPFAAFALYFDAHGALDDALRWGIAFNTHYLAEGPDLATALSRLGMQLVGVVLPSGLVFGASFVGLARLLRRDAPRDAPDVVRHGPLLLVWAAVSLYAVTLGRRFFGHYFLQAELPLALLAAGPVARLFAARPRVAALALGLPALVFFVIASLPSVFGRLVYAADPDYVAIGKAVAARSRPGDTVWVWGNVPQIYFTAERAPGVRFTFCNYLTGLSPGTRSESDPTYDARKNAVPGGWDMVVHDLAENAPAVIVDTAAGGMKSYGKYPVASFPVLADYLAAHYRADGDVDGAVLYRRRDHLDASSTRAEQRRDVVQGQP